MGKSISTLGLCWLPALSVVYAGTAHADYSCSFGPLIRNVAVHHDATSGQEACGVVYHKPPAAPVILWTEQSDVALCEDRAEELVGTLARGGWSCHETPAVAPDDGNQALIAVRGSDQEQAANRAKLPLPPEPSHSVIPRFKPVLQPKAIAARRPEDVSRAAEAVAAAAALPRESGVREQFSQPGIQRAALIEPDVDPPYEVDDISSGPSETVPARPEVKSLLEMRRDEVVVQEWDLSCGAAALATILKYQHGDEVTEREVAKGLINRPEYLDNPDLIRWQQGFSLFDLARYADQRGYKGIGYGELALEDLLEKAPIIVPVDISGYPHFVVFRGKMGDRVLLADPSYGNRTMSVDDFEEAWLDYPEFGRVGFIVAGLDGQAPPNELAPRAEDFVIVR